MGRSLRSILARGASAALFTRVLGTGLALGLQVFFARLLTDEPFGRYAVALAIANVLGMTCVFGFDTAALRFLPQYAVEKDRARAQGFLRHARTFVIAAGLLGAVLLSAGALLFVPADNPLMQRALFAAAILVPLLAWTTLQASFLQAERRILAARTPLLVLRPLLIAILAVAVLRVTKSETPLASQAILFTAAGSLAVAVIYGAVGNPTHRVPKPEAIFERRKWTAMAASLLMLSWFQRLLSQTDVLMIGALASTTQAGYYSVAGRLALLVSFGLAAVNSISAPTIAQLHAQGKQEDLQHTATAAARWSFLFSLAAAAALVLVGRQLLNLFGDGFEVAFVPLLILVCGQMVNALAGSVSLFLTMTGHHMVAAKVLGGTAAINILLNLALIPLWGPLGAAIATATTTALWNVAMIRFVVKRIDINPTILRFGR